jgi:glutaredoxin 3
MVYNIKFGACFVHGFDGRPMKTIRIYTTTNCSYCVAAKRLCQQLGLPFEEIDLTENHELRASLSAQNGHYRTVPMIFIDDAFIGGFTELDQMRRAGKLSS